MRFDAANEYRRKQPTVGVGANRSNPICNGLIGLVTPSGFECTQNGSTRVQSGVVNLRVGSQGIAAYSSSTAAGYLGYDLNAPATIGSDCSFMVYAQAFLTFGFGYRSHLFETTGLAAVNYNLHSGGSNWLFDGATTGNASFDGTVPRVSVATRAGTAVTAYYPLYANSNIGTSTGNTGTLTGLTFGPNRTGTSAVAGVYGYIMAAWNRCLSSNEVFSIARNPWQLFAPGLRTLYFNTTAAAAFKPAWARPKSGVIGAGVN